MRGSPPDPSLVAPPPASCTPTSPPMPRDRPRRPPRAPRASSPAGRGAMDRAVLIMLVSAALHATWNTAMRRHRDARAASVLLLGMSCCVTLAVSLLGGAEPASLKLAFEWGLLAGLSEGLYFITLS